MLKKLVNEAYCTLQITTTGPILIKSGSATISGPDMTPVLTYRNGKQEIFLPGSSLKGVFRSHIEKIVCSLKSGVVCYPFANVEKYESDMEQRKQDYRDSCGDVFNNKSKASTDNRERLEKRTDRVYESSCPTCRLFGSTSFIGRIAISDAYLAPNTPAVTEQRDGVGIDRLTGGSSHGAKFELEVVSSGITFETNIHLRNFEIWQLGMLFIILQDMQDELIHIGSGRSRGLGQVTAKISKTGQNGHPGGFVVSTIRAGDEPVDELWGLGRWLNDGSYGTWKDDYLKNLAYPGQKTPHGIRNLRIFEDEPALNALRDASIQEFTTRMLQWPDRDLSWLA